MIDKKRINVPSVKLHIETLHVDQIFAEIQDRVNRIDKEFMKGFSFIKAHPKSVTFFGSARFEEDHPYYERARSLGEKIAQLGFDVITGGGPGIMQGGNKGAKESGGPGKSLGINIELPFEQVLNPYVDESESFYYFFARKVILTFSAEAYVYFPGGFGTLDEFFEILTLVQTRKIPPVPILLVGREYWEPLDQFIRTTLAEKFKTIEPEDADLYRIVDTDEEVVEIIKNAPLREE
ncbi:TIGR00730 family Rossman fold protein [Candidatus Campbellbacteria bacterium CG22_combo_CG10-13_8_21_14_all_36_13]|uniref:Cytokinin riboside 5'-monophosphate phosphoribohydrolase n=1 Tax=Candidatus Campbellbacteria bacterium CG22_combo_CG10-13_8_21_14_all_36_13 TaxID=1974529 RepID=A0A2H0DXC4_9BACT|nr:MAG: TIGR00730 family Rossman fold protein [Candidatus Campbellbacteria bacterium CG22_combo_CG10-13_8_21_14_all_36_13]